MFPHYFLKINNYTLKFKSLAAFLDQKHIVSYVRLDNTRNIQSPFPGSFAIQLRKIRKLLFHANIYRAVCLIFFFNEQRSRVAAAKKELMQVE